MQEIQKQTKYVSIIHMHKKTGMWRNLKYPLCQRSAAKPIKPKPRLLSEGVGWLEVGGGGNWEGGRAAEN